MSYNWFAQGKGSKRDSAGDYVRPIHAYDHESRRTACGMRPAIMWPQTGTYNVNVECKRCCAILRAVEEESNA